MQVVRIAGQRLAEVVERPDPQPKGEFVTVRIDVAPMCTEYKGWCKGWRGDSLGHEAAGTVEATDGPRRVQPGQRVLVLPQYPCGACELCRRGEYVYCEHSLDAHEASSNSTGTATYAQKMVKQDWMLHPIPDDLSTEQASLANCALGPAFGTLRRLGTSGVHTVLVTGLGPVGLGAVAMAKWFGARVLASEPSAARRELGLALGADAVFDPGDPEILAQVRCATGGVGVDHVLECAGHPASQRMAVDAVRRLGSIAWVGESGEFTTHISNDFIRKGLTVHGSWYYNLADVGPLLAIIRRLGSALEPLVTHRFAMRDVESAFALQERAETGKVMLLPWA